MVLLSIFFHESDLEDHQQIVHSFCRSKCACSSSSGGNITSNSFSVWRFTRWLYIHLVEAYFLQKCQQDRNFCYATNTIKWKTFLIFDINHQQKHKEARPDWNDKNDNANYAPRITWKVLPMAQVAIFKEIFDQVRKDLDCELFYSELNVTTSHIIFTV